MNIYKKAKAFFISLCQLAFKQPTPEPQQIRPIRPIRPIRQPLDPAYIISEVERQGWILIHWETLREFDLTSDKLKRLCAEHCWWIQQSNGWSITIHKDPNKWESKYKAISGLTAEMAVEKALHYVEEYIHQPIMAMDLSSTPVMGSFQRKLYEISWVSRPLPGIFCHEYDMPTQRKEYIPIWKPVNE